MALTNEEARRIDAKVAEKVMGWTMSPGPFGETQDIYQCWHQDGKPILTVHMWNPATSIAAAWEVVVKLKKIMSEFEIELESSSGYPDEWSIGIKWLDSEGEQHGMFYFTSTAAPHAICLAALKAVGVEV